MELTGHLGSGLIRELQYSSLACHGNYITHTMRPNFNSSMTSCIENTRSGSTLLETMLDAHPEIWGMGEDSVFSGHLESFLVALQNAMSIDSGRNQTTEETVEVIANYGNFTINEMSQACLSTTGQVSRYIVDKHLANFINIGKYFCVDFKI